MFEITVNKTMLEEIEIKITLNPNEPFYLKCNLRDKK
jgi:hypothetical protein